MKSKAYENYLENQRNMELLLRCNLSCKNYVRESSNSEFCKIRDDVNKRVLGGGYRVCCTDDCEHYEKVLFIKRIFRKIKTIRR